MGGGFLAGSGGFLVPFTDTRHTGKLTLHTKPKKGVKTFLFYQECTVILTLAKVAMLA